MPAFTCSEKLYFPSFGVPDASNMLCKRLLSDGLMLSEAAMKGLPELMQQVRQGGSCAVLCCAVQAAIVERSCCGLPLLGHHWYHSLLSCLQLISAPDWSNGRDVETWAKRVFRTFSVRTTQVGKQCWETSPEEPSYFP